MNELMTKAILNAHVLVVDDNPRNLQLISTVVGEAGYKVSAVNSGQNALKYLALKQPDIILLDIMMPEMNGFDVCQAIKQEDALKDIPVIFLTAKNEVQDIVKGFNLGAVDYITKPFKTEEVLVRLSTHLQLRHSKKLLLEKKNELEQLNDALHKSKETIKADATRLEKLNAEKDRFFSIIAHDLRGPFAGCIGLTEILATSVESMSNEDIAEYAQTLNETASQINKLLENLLEWARMQMGLVGYNPINEVFVEMIANTISLYEKAANEKKIHFQLQLPNNLQVYADTNMVNSIMRNLLSNAVKFTHPKGSINIVAQPLGNEMIEIQVSDTGIGIPEDLKSKLFRLDQKVSRPGTSGEESTGLGLLLCRDFVQKSGGTFSLESKEGQGSTFKFTLPLAKP
jgi:two-component system, sensor histidine kinase and response regulator